MKARITLALSLVILAASVTASNAQAPSVVGRWQHKDPNLIGAVVFKKDGTGADILGKVESPFVWTQQGNQITAKQTGGAKLTMHFAIMDGELKTTDPGAKTVYIRAK